MISGFAGSFAPLYVLVYVGLGLVGGYMVFIDAQKQEKLALNLAPAWWGIAVVMGPVVGIVAYWFMHHSSFVAAGNDDH